MPFNITTFTFLHVALSVVGLIAGLVVVGGLMAGRHFSGWAGTFLVTTFLTNLSGFGFPFVKLLPSHVLGILSLILIPVVMYALYAKRLEGGWRRTYVVGAVVALYFNAFVLVAQLFHRIPALIVLAPQQKEPPFQIAQLLLLVLFVALGRAAWRGYAGQAGTMSVGAGRGTTATMA
ncbi:MAG TPA: hypothetical protein VFN08_08930 [Gemmatimonadales bacterium]|jgi:hypothetical protein|nr:hypothetical protein [Gemmatimonadales bacterium]